MLKIQLHCIVYKQEIFKNSGLQSDYKIIPSLTDAVTSVDGYYDDSGLIQQERPQRQVPAQVDEILTQKKSGLRGSPLFTTFWQPHSGTPARSARGGAPLLR